MDLYSNLTELDLSTLFGADIERNRNLYAITGMLRLPAILKDPGDVYGFFQEEGEPNFITTGRVEADVVTESRFKDGIGGRIVMIRSADPGYDWIFARGIAGLVTMYGGANSHMAIRASEMKIPAVIGAGEKNFELWSRADTLEIDCAGRLVRVIK